MSEPAGIVLLPLSNTVRVAAALDAADRHDICIADSYADSAETWTPEPWGWSTVIDGRRVWNIDHHAAASRFYQAVSSGNLAIDYVHKHDVLDPAMTVVLNHTDCDSVITAAILRGLLPPDAVFADAVLAADHTGATNPIADLLQALDPLRDFDYSLRNLRQLLGGQAIDANAAELLQKRLDDRRRVWQMVESGRFTNVGRVAVARLAHDEKVPSEFLPQALPAAWVVVVGSRQQDGLWESKVRLGASAPAGMTLFSLGVTEIEPRFGGRWNAGSTRRSGGSPQDPLDLARGIADRI